MNKISKKCLGVFLSAILLGSVASCGILDEFLDSTSKPTSVSPTSNSAPISTVSTSEEISEQEAIYNLAVKSGYEGTYEEWLESIRGDSIDLTVKDGAVCWKHTSEEEWKVLIEVSSLKGETGTNGKEIELNVSTTHIQWRYKGEEAYNNLVALDSLKVVGENGKSAFDIAVELGFKGDEFEWIASLKGEKGEDGREIEFNISTTHIQWRYKGEETYKDLLSLESIKGKDGNNGLSAFEIYVKYHPEYEGTEEDWINDLANGNLSNKDPEIPLENVYTVSFDTGCELEVENQKINEGGKIDKPELSRKGYTLKGWEYKDEAWSFIGFSVTEDMTLEAVWEANQYTIFYSKYGTFGSPVIFELDVTYGESFELPIPTKDGYKFDGWYDENGELFEETVYLFDKDITLNAKWISDSEIYIIGSHWNGWNVDTIKEAAPSLRFEKSAEDPEVYVYETYITEEMVATWVGFKFVTDNTWNTQFGLEDVDFENSNQAFLDLLEVSNKDELTNPPANRTNVQFKEGALVPGKFIIKYYPLNSEDKEMTTNGSEYYTNQIVIEFIPE